MKSSSFHPELCNFIGWALRYTTPSGWVVPKITNHRPLVLRAHYFENNPTLGHYSTLSGVTSIAKEFQIKIGTTNLFIPIYKTINPKNGAEICL
jgi:hypothetical protein